MEKKEKIQEIVRKVFELDSPKIEDSRKGQILEFFETTINGDDIKDELVINVSFGPSNDGVAVYVLTNVRLIRINIELTEIKSVRFFLNKTNIEWKVGADSKTEIKVSSGDTGFNLSYSDDKITNFFKVVDEAMVSATEGRHG